MVDMRDNRRTSWVRIVDTIADKPGAVWCVDHLSRRLLAGEDCPLHEGTQVAWEALVLERKRQVPEHFALISHFGTLRQLGLSARSVSGTRIRQALRGIIGTDRSP